MLFYSRIWRPWNEGPLFSIYMNKSSVKPLQEILRTPANSRASFLALMPKIFKDSCCSSSFSLETSRRGIKKLVGFLNFAALYFPLTIHPSPFFTGWIPFRDLLDPLDAGIFKGYCCPLSTGSFPSSCFFRHPLPDRNIFTNASDYDQNGVMPSFINGLLDYFGSSRFC